MDVLREYALFAALPVSLAGFGAGAWLARRR
jgi:hypothetical protein